MDTQDDRMLPPCIWRLELKRLVQSCLRCAAADEARAVRVAYFLLQLAPPAIYRIAEVRLSESELEAMLAAGDTAEAARRIVGKLASVEMTHTDGRMPHVAALRCDDDVVRSRGATPALAIVSAWAALLDSGLCPAVRPPMQRAA